MKHILILFLFFITFSAYSTNRISVKTGNWNNAATWSPAGTPTAADNITIANGHTITMNGNPGSCLSLTINGTCTWGANRTTNVGAGGITINGNITGTANGKLSTTGKLVINYNTTSTTVTVIMTAVNTISGTGTLGKLQIDNIVTNNANLTINTSLLGTSTLINKSTLTLKGTTIPTLDCSNVSNTYYSGTNQTIKSATYYNLFLTNTGTKTLGGDIILNGDFTNNSTFAASTFTTTINGTVIQYIYGTTPTFYKLTLNAGTKLTATSLIVSNNLLLLSPLSNGATGSLIVDNLTVNGTTTVERYVSKDRWWYLSSPISNPNSSLFNCTDINAGLFSFSETANAYTQIKTAQALNVMQGYGIKYKTAYAGSLLLQFIGPINIGNKNINLTYSSVGKGWNMVGNPYSSAIDWNSITSTNMSDQICYRTNLLWATYNKVSGIGTNAGTQYIPAMSAFWVKTYINNNLLTITNAARVHSGQVTYRIGSFDNLLSITASRGTYKDETILYFNSNAKKEYDSYDTDKTLNTDNNIPQIYFKNNYNLAVNSIDTIQDTIIPLWFRAKIADNYSLSFDGYTSFTNKNIYLIDNLLGREIDLSIDISYAFYSNITDDENRFMIKIINGNTLPITILNFYTACNNDDISITWATASEMNVDKFIIQKSLDGINYEDIYRLQACGNCNNINTYDIDIKQYEYIAYYRLKELDFDGKYFYYGPLVSSCDTKDNFNIYINSESIDITFESDIEEVYTIKIFNIAGSMVYNTKRISNIGLNEINVKLNIKEGLYILVYSSDNRMIIKKFVN